MAGSWHGSPTMTTLLGLNLKGIRVEGSTAWAASSEGGKEGEIGWEVEGDGGRERYGGCERGTEGKGVRERVREWERNGGWGDKVRVRWQTKYAPQSVCKIRIFMPLSVYSLHRTYNHSIEFESWDLHYHFKYWLWPSTGQSTTHNVSTFCVSTKKKKKKN